MARKFRAIPATMSRSRSRQSTTYSVPPSIRARWVNRFRMYVPMPKSRSFRASRAMRTAAVPFSGIGIREPGFRGHAACLPMPGSWIPAFA
jgi:hypothetical protein